MIRLLIFAQFLFAEQALFKMARARVYECFVSLIFNKPFSICIYLCVKTSLGAQFFIWTTFISRLNHLLCARPRFETEVKSNSKMVHSSSI